MKTFFSASLLLAWAFSAQAQGTLRFRNFDDATGFSAPAFRSDCVTPLSGTNYMAEVLVAPDYLAGPWQTIAQTPFLTGARAGYFDGGICTITNFPAGSELFVTIRAWNEQLGPSYAYAYALGVADAFTQQITFRLTLGDQSSPTVLTGLPALWLNKGLDVPLPPAFLYVNFNRVDNTAVVSWESNLEVSTNLVQWTNFIGSSPHAFPLTQGPSFFRAKL